MTKKTVDLELIDSAISIIEDARSYTLLSNESPTLPIMIRDRANLEIILEGVKADMVIATAGTYKRCIVIIDFTFQQLKDIIDSKRKYHD